MEREMQIRACRSGHRRAGRKKAGGCKHACTFYVMGSQLPADIAACTVPKHKAKGVDDRHQERTQPRWHH